MQLRKKNRGASPELQLTGPVAVVNTVSGFGVLPQSCRYKTEAQRGLLTGLKCLGRTTHWPPCARRRRARSMCRPLCQRCFLP